MNGSLLKYNLLISDTRPDPQNPHQIVNNADPILDLMELSGFSLLFSEFHKDCKIWKSVRKIWDEFLYGDEGEATFGELSKITVLRSIIKLKKEILANTQREILRNRWRQEAEEFICSKVEMERINRGGLGVGPLQPQHPKPLVRIFAIRHSSIGGINIFSDFYLYYFPENLEGSSRKEKDRKINKTNLRERVISEN